MAKKKIERICGNCRLFDPKNGQCAVVILHEGQRLHLPVEPKDTCFYEESYFDPIEKEVTNFVDDLRQVRFWVEDENGNKTDGHGTVKMEIPEGFFGNYENGMFGFPDIDVSAGKNPPEE